MTLPMLISPLLNDVPGIRHGFFTRQGGVSQGLYDSLNVGRGSDDAPENVAENRDRIRQALGAKSLNTVYQVHSARVVTTADAEADGLVTDDRGCAVGILTADCVPILLARSDGSRVAAVHSGWKGTVGGICEAAVQSMGTSDLIAVIGPAIAQDSYEVGQDLFEAAKAPTFFKPGRHDGKYQFDLPGLVRANLENAGVSAIDLLAEDTYSQPHRFFSYRRTTHESAADYGRQMSAIVRVG